MHLIIRWLTRITLTISAVLMMAVVFIVCFDVIARYGFNRPTVWANEITIYSFIWLGLMATVASLGRDQHLRVLMVVEKLAPRVQWWLYTFVLSLMFLFSSVLVWQGYRYWWEAQSRGYSQSFTYLNWPLSITRIAVPITGIFFCLIVGLKFYDHILSRQAPRPTPEVTEKGEEIRPI